MGNQFKKLRKSRSLSREKMAEMLDSSANTIYNYEKGKTSIPHNTIVKMCEMFEVSSDYFYFEVDEMKAFWYLPKEEDIIRDELARCSMAEQYVMFMMMQIAKMNF